MFQLSVCLFSLTLIQIYIYIYIYIALYSFSDSCHGLHESISCCLWWSLRVLSSISCLAAILNFFVAPSNKEFHFLYALGLISEFFSIFNMVAILDLVVAPGNKEFYFLLLLGQFSEVLYKFNELLLNCYH